MHANLPLHLEGQRHRERRLTIPSKFFIRLFKQLLLLLLHSPMAISSKVALVFVALSLLSLDLVHAGSSMATSKDPKGPTPTPLPPPAIDCDAACAVRCSLSSRPNLCKRACGTCCFRCHCVPSGTAGHYEECPCYASQTTHGGVRKCP